MFDFAFHLGIHIECTNGTPVLDILDNYPPLPLFVNYNTSDAAPSYPILQDELGIYRTLRLHDHIRQIHLSLPSPILHKALVLMGGRFPILEHLFLSFTTENHNISLTLPETFLAPNLRHLTLPDVSPHRLLRFLTTTVSVITLKLSNIQTRYFLPRLLVAHLRLLPQLEELTVVCSTPIPSSVTEEKLLGGEETPVILPNLKTFSFKGRNAYLECLVSQISTPLLEQLHITLFSETVLSQPRLSHLINTTKVFKPLRATVNFGVNEVSVYTAVRGGFVIRVRDMPLNWRVDWAAQICNALVPTLPSVEHLTLGLFSLANGPDWQPNGIDSTTWHILLRSFIGVKKLHIDHGLTWELSWALRAGGVGTDPEFLPNLQSIVSETNMFTSFIDARQVVGRPVKFSTFSWPPQGWSQTRSRAA